jgi:hypothetical protein
MGSKLKKRVKNLIEMIETMIVEPDDEGNDVIINRSINEYEVKVAMANDFDISKCQWISRIFSYPISNTVIKEKKSNMDFLLGETVSSSNIATTATTTNNNNNNKYKEYNDSDDASLKLRLDNFKAHMLSKFRYESNMIKIKVPIEAYINDNDFINGKEYFTEWKHMVMLILLILTNTHNNVMRITLQHSINGKAVIAMWWKTQEGIHSAADFAKFRNQVLQAKVSATESKGIVDVSVMTSAGKLGVKANLNTKKRLDYYNPFPLPNDFLFNIDGLDVGKQIMQKYR